MLTSDTHSPRVSITLLVVAAGLVAGALFVRLGTARTGADGPLPADILALGTKVVPAAPDGTVSRDAALEAADLQFGITDFKTSAYLVDLTNPNQLGGITDRAFWIFKVEGITVPLSHPKGENGPASFVEWPTVLYVFVDANTGQFVMAQTP